MTRKQTFAGVFVLLLVSSVMTIYQVQAAEENGAKKERLTETQKQHRRRARPQLQVVEGEILRFFEERGKPWSSSVILKDSWGKEWKISADTVETLVKYGPQVEVLHSLMGGMKVTVLYREIEGVQRASVINIESRIRE